MIIGVDVGYSTTKTSSGVLFDSKAGLSDGLLGGKAIAINGIAYTVGDGANCMDVNRVDSELFRVCLIAAIALSDENETDFKVVTGLPIGQYKSQKHNLSKVININRCSSVTINGKHRNITISDHFVYAQGAGALFASNIKGNAIIVDIGSRTCDIALFTVSSGTRNLSKYSTLFCGMYGLYTKAITAINMRFGLSLPPEYCEQVFSNGLVLDGEKQPIDFLQPVFASYLNDLINELSINYPVRNVPVYLCGGGAYVLGGILKRKFPHCSVMENAQFSNADGFRKVGEKTWMKIGVK